MADFAFRVLSKSGQARRGQITTAHGKIETPAFMPVGTRASVKAMMPEDVRSTGADIILANTYHLMLRPGEELVQKLGGLHKFMNWPGPILTDSGGFQVMSLQTLRKISEEGVEFRSHIDGSKYFLSPRYATQIQHCLDSTISMVLDECTPHPASYEYSKESMERTSRWAKKSRDSFIKRKGYAQFAIMQGALYKDLRQDSASSLVDMDFEGYAIGGLAVGEGTEKMLEVLDYAPDMLPQDKPRYLMGVGKPADIIAAVARGVDMFDCVIPTRSGRNGQAFTAAGTINIRNQKYKTDSRPLEEGCPCPACTSYSRAYLHHLVRAGEMQGSMLMTWHNLSYYQRLMKRIRSYIEQGKDIDFDC